MGFLPDWIKSLFKNDVDYALDQLRQKLKEKGYNIDYPPDDGDPEFRMGMRIWIVLADPVNGDNKSNAELMQRVREIKDVNLEVAKQFGLIPTGLGPVVGENALVFAYCGFRTFLW